MYTKVRIKEYIQTGYNSTNKSEKIEVVANAAYKFINKYRATHWVGAHFFEDVINACLQQYSVEKDLSTFLEREKNLWLGNPIKIISK